MSQPRVSLPDPSDEADDSPFLSLADFFSLIALTVIYIVIVFSPQSPMARNMVEAVSGVASNTGPAASLQGHIAYVALLPDGTRIMLRVMRPEGEPVEERAFPLSAETYDSAQQWLASALAQGQSPARVLFYMDGGESRPEANRLFLVLVRATQPIYPTSIVFLDAGAALPQH